MTRNAKNASMAGSVLKLSTLAAVYVIGVLLARQAFQDSLTTESAASSPATQAAAPLSRVTAGGVTLTSVNLEFPADDQPYAGPGADVMNANCTACHSANMALNQPHLSPADWTAEVDKMRGTYKATVADKDVPVILKYLNAMSARLPPGGAPAPSAPSRSASSASG
jgi:mono/diheme cytochrome c family protein